MLVLVPRYCQCGCGARIKPGTPATTKFLRGHCPPEKRGFGRKPRIAPEGPAPFCGCGCGKQVTLSPVKKAYSTFLKGHCIRWKKHGFYSKERTPAEKNRFFRLGVTPEQYNILLVKQGGTCAICHGGNNGKSFHLDHNHKTGKIRGLLCTQCNTGIGQFHDSPTTLRAAANYLEEDRAASSARVTLTRATGPSELG